MANEWQLLRLGDYSLKIGSGATPRGGENVYKTNGISLIRSQNVYNNSFDFNGLVHIDDGEAEKLANVVVQPGDILLNITGDSVARVCAVPDEVLPARVNQHVALIRPDPSVWDTNFVKYFLVSPAMQSYMLGLASAGATRNALTKGMIENFRIPAPDKEIQRAIASILGSLDDKIELNHRTNAALEETARALFKSWFVDFDPVRAKMEGRQPDGLDAETAALFPVRLVESELGLIPEGWRVSSIGQEVEFAYGKALKEDVRKSGPIPVYGSNGQIGWHDEALVRAPGIVIGRKGNPGTVTWVQDDFFPIDTTFYIMKTGAISSLPYLYYALRSLRLPSLGADSAVPGLNRNLAYMTAILVPSTKTTDLFDTFADHLFNSIHSNERGIRTLAATRDTLLPKLLSGEVRVEK